jgi:hypothetical protein
MTAYYEVRYVHRTLVTGTKRFSSYEEASIYLIDCIIESMWSEGFYWGPISSFGVSVFSKHHTNTINFEGPMDENYGADLECRLNAIHASWLEEELAI